MLIRFVAAADPLTADSDADRLSPEQARFAQPWSAMKPLFRLAQEHVLVRGSPCCDTLRVKERLVHQQDLGRSERARDGPDALLSCRSEARRALRSAPSKADEV